MKKKKVIKPDDYYNDGMFELARFGKVFQMKNNLTPQMHKKYLEMIANEFEGEKEKISDLVDKIRKNVKVANPTKLMNFLVFMNFINMKNKISEIEYSAEECFQMRSLEYVQSVLVSSKSSYESKNSKEDQSVLYFEIMAQVIELYQKLQMFYPLWAAKVIKEKEIEDDEIIKYILEAQLMGLVRGTRYQQYQIPHLEDLLLPHDEAIYQAYELSAEELILGVRKLEYSLSSGKVDAISDMYEVMDELGKVNDDAESEEKIHEYVKSVQDKNAEKIHRFIGLALYDVKKVTGWNSKIIDYLSYEIGEDISFYEHEDYKGWPIWNLPVQKKPFIKINGISYCFDYYNLFDNFYRIIQKSIREIIPGYVNDWSHIQQTASETMVEKLFKKLLPESKIYRDNYYPKNNSLKECAENDVLVVYKDVLIIVEVKAGSFTYTPALTDYKAHVQSFKALVEKADNQCERTRTYVIRNETAVIYDHENEKKVELRKKDFTQIYSFCVTIDDFNAFAAKAEKLSFINLRTGTISISVDDLRIYADYFDSPIKFIHFLKQRSLATTLPMLTLNDELDHLGMYIKHNVYSITASKFEEKSIVQMHGYREALDNYFASLHNASISYEKPVQKLPPIYEEIIAFYEQNNETEKITEFTNFLLDLSSDSREQLVKEIQYGLRREKEIGKMFPMLAFGDVRYCLYIEQPGITEIPNIKRMDYVYSAILKNCEENHYYINMKFNEQGKFQNISQLLLEKKDIPVEKVPFLEKQAELDAQSRTYSFMIQNNKKKIYPNDQCPCGSGKKYKKCCGRYLEK